MTENIPPVPPAPEAPEPGAPQKPAQPPAGYTQPAPQAYAPPAGYAQPPTYPQPAYQQQPAAYPQQYAPGYQSPAPQPQHGQPSPYAQPPAQYGQPTQYVQPGQWVPAGPPRAKSSGYRVASGIVSIALGLCLFLQFFVDVSMGLGFLAFMCLVAAFGTMTSGIVLLAKQWGRQRGVPVTALSFAGFAVLVGVCHLGVRTGVGMLLFDVLLAVPVLIVMGLGLQRETRGL